MGRRSQPCRMTYRIVLADRESPLPLDRVSGTFVWIAVANVLHLSFEKAQRHLRQRIPRQDQKTSEKRDHSDWMAFGSFSPVQS